MCYWEHYSMPSNKEILGKVPSKPSTRKRFVPPDEQFPKITRILQPVVFYFSRLVDSSEVSFMFDRYHSSQLEFIAIVPFLSTFIFGFILVPKTFSTISVFFFFSWSGWHIKKVQLIQRFKMCLLRRLFPNSTAFPWQNICFLPLHCLFIWSEKEQESKRQQIEFRGFAWNIPRKKQLTK